MMFWLAVAMGVVFALIGIRLGFYRMWAVLFNILVSIYLGVMLTPAMVKIIPSMENFYYHRPLSVAAIAIVAFAVLQTIAVTLIGAFEVSFPKMFNNIGSVILGFLSGYLLVIFVLFVICVIPFSKQGLVSWQRRLKPTAARPVVKVCDFVGSASLHVCDGVALEVVSDLISRHRPGDEPDYSDEPYEEMYKMEQGD